VKRTLLVAAALLGAALLFWAIRAMFETATVDLASLAWRTPRRTALMRAREAAARKERRAYRIDQRTVPYDHVSPLLRRAVLVAEDDAFFSHGGLDWNEIRASARANLSRGRVVRGGSTITQQLAKNLYLGEERTAGRKLEEAALAIRIERTLTKRRIFELYLNLIEWGDGVFGAEAAARRWFGVSSSDLDPRQACLLAAVIVNPRRYSPLHPSRRIERRVAIIASRLRRAGVLGEEEYRVAVGLTPASRPGWLSRVFGGLFGGAPDTTVGVAADTTLDAAPAPEDSIAEDGVPADSLGVPGR
jgi:monofunctional biosynthetic peptidoglycan transglycosylase